jgi:hypothetical protein
MESKNCINCTDFSVTDYMIVSYACNAIFCCNLSITYITPHLHTYPKKIAYTIYILYYYYIYTTIYSIKGVFAFLGVQFLCNFLQFLSISAIFLNQ